MCIARRTTNGRSAYRSAGQARSARTGRCGDPTGGPTQQSLARPLATDQHVVDPDPRPPVGERVPPPPPGVRERVPVPAPVPAEYGTVGRAVEVPDHHDRPDRLGRGGRQVRRLPVAQGGSPARSSSPVPAVRTAPFKASAGLARCRLMIVHRPGRGVQPVPGGRPLLLGRGRAPAGRRPGPGTGWPGTARASGGRATRPRPGGPAPGSRHSWRATTSGGPRPPGPRGRPRPRRNACCRSAPGGGARRRAPPGRAGRLNPMTGPSATSRAAAAARTARWLARRAGRIRRAGGPASSQRGPKSRTVAGAQASPATAAPRRRGPGRGWPTPRRPPAGPTAEPAGGRGWGRVQRGVLGRGVTQLG